MKASGPRTYPDCKGSPESYPVSVRSYTVLLLFLGTAQIVEIVRHSKEMLGILKAPCRHLLIVRVSVLKKAGWYSTQAEVFSFPC